MTHFLNQLNTLITVFIINSSLLIANAFYDYLFNRFSYQPRPAARGAGKNF